MQHKPNTLQTSGDSFDLLPIEASCEASDAQAGGEMDKSNL